MSKSGTRLAIAATSMSTAKAHWWTGNSPDIVEAAEASSALPPFLFPKILGNDWYIDGSLMVSTPIVKALQDGATTVLVIQPTASEGHMGLSTVNAVMKSGSGVGLKLAELLQTIFDRYFFLEAALSEACIRWPNAQILGWVPSHNLGPPLSFNREHIDQLIRWGRETAGAYAPKDLCQLYNKTRYTKSSDSDLAAEANAKKENFDVSEGIAVAIIAASGVLGMSIGFVFSKVRSRKPYNLHGKLLQDASC